MIPSSNPDDLSSGDLWKVRMETSRPQRYHALDALRAAMMLLGLVLHSAASYIQAPPDWTSSSDTRTRGIGPD